MDPKTLRTFAESLAREAGELLRGLVGGPLEIREKGAVDLVTRADRESEALIVRRIREEFPGHAVLAEESAPRGGVPASKSGPLWIVDPLDGTTNFAHGLPIWSVSIACLLDGIALAGVVHDPNRNECFSASRGGGAALNGAPIRVGDRRTLRESLLVTGFPYDVQTDAVDNLDHFARFIKETRAVRRLGSAALDLAYVACGRFDGFWELKLQAWDVAAGALLVEEAGGSVGDFDGNAFDPFAREIAAANSTLLGAMIEVLRRGRRPEAARTPSP